MNQQELKEQIEALLETIKDPEFTHMTLGDLKVITKNSVFIQTVTTPWKSIYKQIQITIKPTTPHCHLVQQIGLSIHLRLRRELQGFQSMKMKILCEPGSHLKQQEVQKQMNDKERIAAALQNSQILTFLESLMD